MAEAGRGDPVALARSHDMQAARVILGLLATLAGPTVLAGDWTPLTSGTTRGLHSVWFTDAQTGFAAGPRGSFGGGSRDQ